MSISVTKNQENFSPLKWAALGAVAGCVVKDMHPVTEAEKDYYEYDKYVVNRKDTVRRMIKSEIPEFKNILGNKFNQEGYDAFIKLVEPPKSAPDREAYIKSTYAKLSEEAKTAFDILFKHIETQKDELKKQQDYVFEALIKKNRSIATYAFVGGLITTGAAFITYVISKMSNSVKS